VVQVATDVETARWGLELSERHRSSVRVHPTAGLYPSRAALEWQAMTKELRQLLETNKFVAVGEVGIDLYHDKSYLERQVEMLKVQLELALEFSLPLIFHIRDSFDEVYSIIEPFSKESHFSGVWHCFEGTLEQAQTMVSIGLYISFSGIVTFPRNEALRAVAKQIPLQSILIETDSPYLSPHPMRNERNEPYKVKWVLDCIAKERNCSSKDLECATESNTRRLFQLEDPSIS